MARHKEAVPKNAKHNQDHGGEEAQPQGDEAMGNGKKTARSDSERIAVLERNFRVLVKKLHTHGIHLTSDTPAALDVPAAPTEE